MFSKWKEIKKKYNITKTSKVTFPLKNNKTVIQVQDDDDFLDIRFYEDRWFIIVYTNLKTFNRVLQEQGSY